MANDKALSEPVCLTDVTSDEPAKIYKWLVTVKVKLATALFFFFKVNLQRFLMAQNVKH